MRGLEPLTPCLQSVNSLGATEWYGLLSCAVFLAFRGLDPAPGLLLSAMVSYLAVHQIVHQFWRSGSDPRIEPHSPYDQRIMSSQNDDDD